MLSCNAGISPVSPPGVPLPSHGGNTGVYSIVGVYSVPAVYSSVTFPALLPSSTNGIHTTCTPTVYPAS